MTIGTLIEYDLKICTDIMGEPHDMSSILFTPDSYIFFYHKILTINICSRGWESSHIKNSIMRVRAITIFLKSLGATVQVEIGQKKS